MRRPMINSVQDGLPAASSLQFDEWLWSAAAQLDSLRVRDLSTAAAAAGVAFPQITVSTVICDDDAAALERLAERGIGVTDIRATPWGGVLRAELSGSEYVVALFRSSQAGVASLVGSVPFTDKRWSRVDRSWIPAAQPHVSAVFLNRRDFEDIGDVLAEHGPVRVSRMTARVLKDSSSYSRGWSRLRPTHSEALSETDGMLVGSLSVSVGERLSAHLRRSAGATFYRGDFQLFVDVVLDRLVRAAGERRELLSNRSRIDSVPLAETLTMSLVGVALGPGEFRRRLLEAVNGARSARTAVLHANPYLHVIVTDHLDGSSFDVFLTSEDRLSIVPGLRASVGSLARLTDVLGEALGMDELRAEPVPTEIPASEFFATG